MKIPNVTCLTGSALFLLLSGGGYAQDSDGEGQTDAQVADAAGTAPRDFNRDLLTVEEEVNALKERVFRSKATLQLLKEIVIQGAASGSGATIWHVNRLGNAYNLESISYYLDGQGKFSKADTTGVLDDNKEFKVYDGSIPPGDHTVSVNVKLRGNGLGIFNYVDKYEVNLKANTSFAADEGKNCQVRVILEKKKGVGRSFTDRPNVSFETRCITTQGESGEEQQ